MIDFFDLIGLVIMILLLLGMSLFKDFHFFVKAIYFPILVLFLLGDDMGIHSIVLKSVYLISLLLAIYVTTLKYKKVFIRKEHEVFH